MTPDQYCQQRAAQSGSSFYYSFLFLPEERRKAITALYAFCREVDDVVDECSEPDIARVKLNWWRQTLQRTFEGAPEHPVQKALAGPIERYNLPLEYFLEIIDGMEMDLNHTRYDTFSTLSLYCYRVAGVVGLLAAEIFGYQQRATLNYAYNLGIAFQLTNIIRDIREDAARGRIYLPLDELERFAVTTEDLLQGRDSAAVRELLRFQVNRAADYYRQALESLPERDRHSQRSGLIMAAIYRRTLRAIEDRDYRVLDGRISLTPLHKLWIAWRTNRAEKRRYRRIQAGA